MTEETPVFATVDEFAALLKVSRKTVERAIASGLLVAVRVRSSPQRRGTLRLHVARNLARLEGQPERRAVRRGRPPARPEASWTTDERIRPRRLYD
jgi:excisionase family DNA binding protein